MFLMVLAELHLLLQFMIFLAAHGVCAILQMLISVPGYVEGLGDSKARDDIKATIDYLLNLQTPSGNFPCAMDEIPPNITRPESEELVHWCHGAPGMIYLLVSLTKPILCNLGSHKLFQPVIVSR